MAEVLIFKTKVNIDHFNLILSVDLTKYNEKK